VAAHGRGGVVLQHAVPCCILRCRVATCRAVLQRGGKQACRGALCEQLVTSTQLLGGMLYVLLIVSQTGLPPPHHVAT
jgi:hypothetical protein